MKNLMAPKRSVQDQPGISIRQERMGLPITSETPSDVCIDSSKNLRPVDFSELTAPRMARHSRPVASFETMSDITITPGQKVTLLGGLKAIEIEVAVNGERVRAVLADATFGKSRRLQKFIAQDLYGRLAKRAENLTVLNVLLEKERSNNLNSTERSLLKIYRKNSIRDDSGMLELSKDRVEQWGEEDSGKPSASRGALIVLPLTRSLSRPSNS